MSSARYKPDKPFVMHSLRLLASEAWQSLSGNDLKILSRLELEHLRHAGKQNGNIVCPVRDLGVRRHSIKPALARLIAKGMLEIKRGRPGTVGYGKAHRYRLTYLPTWAGKWVPPTDEWAKTAAPLVVTKRHHELRGDETAPRS